MEACLLKNRPMPGLQREAKPKNWRPRTTKESDDARQIEEHSWGRSML